MSQCKSYRDYIYLEDVANDLRKRCYEWNSEDCFSRKKIEKGVYNLGSGNFIIIFNKLIRFNNKFLKIWFNSIKKTETIKKLYGL